MKKLLFLLFIAYYIPKHSQAKGNYGTTVVYSHSLAYVLNGREYIEMNPGDSVVLSAYYYNGMFYSYPDVTWTLNGVPINQVQSNQITIRDTGTIDYQRTGFGTTEIVLLYSAPTSIEDVKDHSTRVYPNPASNELFVATKGSFKKYELNIFSAEGKIVYEQFDCTGNTSINISSLPAGIYFVFLKPEDGKNEITRLLVE